MGITRFKMIKNILSFVLCIGIVCSIFCSEGLMLDSKAARQQGYDAAYAWKMLEIINKERKNAGLSELIMEQGLLNTANIRAAEIEVKFGHERPDGSSCFSAFEFPSVQTFVGENIAAGQTSPDSVMKSWMNSQGHRENILNPEFKSIGIACYYVPNSTYKFYWVQCFGNNIGKKAYNGNSELVYNGVDYSSVYNYSYYVNKYPDVKKSVGNNKVKALEHFVKYGMKEGRRASKNFDVYSYAYRYADLRKSFKNNLVSYYYHFMNYGVAEGRKATGTTKMKNYAVKYKGKNYKAVYNYNFYMKKYPKLFKKYGLNDEAALKNFVENGMKLGRQGSENFNVYTYKSRYSNLRKNYGSNLKKYYMHYINKGKAKGYSGK